MKAVVYIGDNSAEYMDVDEPVKLEGQTRVNLSFAGFVGLTCMLGMGMMKDGFLPCAGPRSCWPAKDGPYEGHLVAINPLMRCRNCPSCQTGDEHLCASRELIGMRVPGLLLKKSLLIAQI